MARRRRAPHRLGSCQSRNVNSSQPGFLGAGLPPGPMAPGTALAGTLLVLSSLWPSSNTASGLLTFSVGGGLGVTLVVREPESPQPTSASVATEAATAR